MGQKSVNLKNLAKENSDLTEHISKTEEKNNENNSKSKRKVQKKKISRENKTQIREFLDFLEFEKGSSKNTITGYNRDLLQFFLFAQKNFSEIEEKDIFEYIENLNEKLRRNSVLRKVSALKTFYKFCYLNNKFIPSTSLIKNSLHILLPPNSKYNKVLHATVSIKFFQYYELYHVKSYRNNFCVSCKNLTQK